MKNGPRIPGSYSPKSSNSESLTKHQVLYELFGELVEEIKAHFFNLNVENFLCLIANYRQSYGDKAADYAVKTMQSWRAGDVRLSGQTMERLLEQVPPFLEDAIKISLLVKLLRQSNPQVVKKTFRLNREATQSSNKILSALLVYTESITAIETVPERILKASLWLNNKDALRAKAMLAEADEVVYGPSRRTVHREILELMMALESGKASRPHYAFVLPGLLLDVIVTSNVTTANERVVKPITAKDIDTNKLTNTGVAIGCCVSALVALVVFDTIFSRTSLLKPLLLHLKAALGA